MNSIIKIQKDALAKNLAFLRSLFHPEVRISSVVKGNAYGHGIDQYIPLAESLGVDHFSVYSSDEARQVMKILKDERTQLMIMGYVDLKDLSWVIQSGISFFVFDFHRLSQTIETASMLKIKAQVHIELETGMNRTGFSQHELDRLIELMLENKEYIEFTGLCTHFAGAESISNYLRVEHQKAEFLKMEAQFKNAGLSPKIRHTCCSAASIRLPDMHMDMVRIGILQYGFWPSREIFIEYLKNENLREDPLKRLISWESRIMNIKHIEMGEFVGYGTTYLAQKDMKIAVIPIGYAHGFSRAFSNQGRAIVNGVRTAVIGMVNMNCTILDVSDIEDVKIDDKVTLIGSNGDYDISVSSFGELSDQLNYELLTRLPHNIPRKVI